MFKLIQKGIQAITDYKNLTSKQATSIMQEILSGVATQAQTSAFITALKIKGETIEEITNGKGVDVILDIMGASYLQKNLNAPVKYKRLHKTYFDI